KDPDGRRPNTLWQEGIFRRRFPLKRRQTREQKIKRGAQTVNVRLNAKVAGAERQVGSEVIGRTRVAFAGEEAGRRQTDYFDRARSIEDKVTGFEMAMGGPGLVNMVQTFGRLTDVMSGPEDVQRPVFPHNRLEVIAVDKLQHDEVLLAILANPAN